MGTDSSAELRALARYMATYCVGESNAMTAAKLCKVVGDELPHEALTNPKTRGLLRRLTMDLGVPVSSGRKGFWLPGTVGELWAYTTELRGRAEAMVERAVKLENAAPGLRVLGVQTYAYLRETGGEPIA